MSLNLKISVIHNVFRYNPYIAETLQLNLIALEKSQVPYQYIIFNDNGDKMIELDIKYLMNENTEYIYSDINYGQHKCTGGWIGAQPYVKGDIIHNIGHDDVMTSLFYENAYQSFLSNNDNMFFTSNGFVVNEDLSYKAYGLQPELEYNTPENVKCAFVKCMGVKDNKVTNLYNPFIASGTMYKKILHKLIGLPDIDTFGGISDFEYWMRILFNGYIGTYVNKPLLYFRMSEIYTTGNEIINGKPNRAYWDNVANELMIEKYNKLLQVNN